MRLIGRYNSPYVRRVAVTMGLYGLDYAHENVMPFGAEKDGLAAVNPLRRVPVLVLDDGEAVVDSAAILDCLDDLVGPEKALTPARGAARRRVQTCLSVATGAMDKLVAVLYERHFRPKETQHRPWIEMCERQVVDGFQWLDRQGEGDWLAGGAMSQADVTAAVFWRFGAEKRPGFFGRMDCPRLKALSERLEATPAFRGVQPAAEGLTDQIA